jgi:hypothetical protein
MLLFYQYIMTLLSPFVLKISKFPYSDFSIATQFYSQNIELNTSIFAHTMKLSSIISNLHLRSIINEKYHFVKNTYTFL